LISQNNNNFWRGQDWLYQLLKEEDTGWVELFEKAGWKPIVVP
jgi:hypothetical protein